MTTVSRPTDNPDRSAVTVWAFIARVWRHCRVRPGAAAMILTACVLETALFRCRAERDRATVLTFFDGNPASPDELAAERFKLLETPFGDYEQSIRDDLARIMAGTAFDVDRDVSAIYLYRWGHALTMPVPGHLFGAGRDRKASPRRVAAAALGRISFAGQETERTPSVECAIASGDRACKEALKYL